MPMDRRSFLKSALKVGLVRATAPLWSSQLAHSAFAQSGLGYKAMIMVSLVGGNDGNNMIVPLDRDRYAAYAALRSSIALPVASCLPLNTPSGSPGYGLHPSLPNVARLYNAGRASVVANVGPLSRPLTKDQLLANPGLIPAQLLSHPAGRLQWATSAISADASSGWGGRMGDQFAAQSGKLPPVFNASNATVFTVGHDVQAISVQANTVQYATLPAGMNSAILGIANNDTSSRNRLVAQAAQMRASAMQQQIVIEQAQQSTTGVQTVFPDNPLGSSFKAIVQLMKGRSVVGASRQIFYTEQDGTYDTHAAQLDGQKLQLAELDAALAALVQGIDEIGLTDSVLVCTSSDFNRTMQANSTAGTDHAWGNHQLVIGGSGGGRILGSLPDLELGGSADLYTQGVWIPQTSVTQMAAGIGRWMGLSGSQLGTVFPDLSNFPAGALSL